MTDNASVAFVSSLNGNDRKSLSKIPKSDLHSHSALGSRFFKLQQWYGQTLPLPPKRMEGIAGMDAYLSHLREIFFTRAGFEYTLKASFLQAVEDGVTVLEMSIDCRFVRQFEDREVGLVRAIDRIHKETAPQICFIPQLGITREADTKIIFPEIESCIDTGYFKSIDIYGEELFRPPEVYKEVYRNAKRSGLRLKAHTGEFGDADSIKRTVEVLELDEIQHGIRAASSPSLMKWLSDHKIRLNVCPTSNVVLGVVDSLGAHPARVLFDRGLILTLNSDDILLFDQSVCDEFFNVFNARLFSAKELDQIRRNGLEQARFYQ